MKPYVKWIGGVGMTALVIIGISVFQKSAENEKNPTGESPKLVSSSRRTTGAQESARVRQWHPLIDASLPREERLALVGKIHGELSSEETDYLFKAMSHTPPPEDQDNWWVVLNEIMEVMREQGAGKADYTRRMSTLISDDELSEVARDYAIQHLGNWLAPAVPNESPGESDSSKRKDGLMVIATTIKDPSLIHTGIPGTGLMTLADASTRLDNEVTAPAWSALKSFMTEVIEGKSEASPLIRSAAIQAAARGRRTEYLPFIRELVQTQRTDPSLRLSSISALGSFANAEDESLLRSFTSSDNAFQYAARAALQNLQAASAN